MDSADFQTAVFANLDDLVELSTTDVCEARKKGLGLSCSAADLAERSLQLAEWTEFLAGARFKNLRPMGLKFKDRPSIHPNFEKWAHTYLATWKTRGSADPVWIKIFFYAKSGMASAIRGRIPRAPHRKA